MKYVCIIVYYCVTKSWLLWKSIRHSADICYIELKHTWPLALFMLSTYICDYLLYLLLQLNLKNFEISALSICTQTRKYPLVMVF